MEQRTTGTLEGSSTPSGSANPNRKQRRANKAAGRKQENRAGVIAARIEELRKGWLAFSTTITKQVEAIRQAFNQNHRAYSEGFTNLDARLSVMQAVVNDVYVGKVLEDESGNIDWDAYLKVYQEHLKDLLAKEQEAQAAAESVSADIVDELREEVYGGDYGTGTQELGDRQVSEGVEEPAGEDAAGNEQGGGGNEHGSRPEPDEMHELPRDDEADEGG